MNSNILIVTAFSDTVCDLCKEVIVLGAKNEDPKIAVHTTKNKKESVITC